MGTEISGGRQAAIAIVFALAAVACGDDGETVADAGLVDAGRVDASAGDAGERDAGERDAGERDAGEPDDAGIGADAGVRDPLAGMGSVELLARAHDGTDFGFLEGPHWRTDHLVFSDLQASPARIYTYSETSGVSLLLTSADGVNGNATGPRGEHYACAMFGRYFGEVVDGELVSLFDSFEGDRLNAPNDVVVSATGALYFTDPGYGISAPDYELEHHSVYRWDGETLTEVWAGSREQRPNGVGLSPDDAILYLADTADGVLRAFDVQPDGSLANEREFAEAPMADGLTLDEAGNIYVTTSAGVAVFAPDGSSWGTISVPMTPANCGFGGADRRTLFITARTGLYAVQLGIPGIAGR